MSMTACSGCGLPRAEDQLASPCPICAAGAVAAAEQPVPVAKTVASDPTRNLPADVNAMNRAAVAAEGFPVWFRWAAVFGVGVAVGAAGVLAWQPMSVNTPTDVARATPTDPRPLPQLPPAVRRVEVAPVPHEPTVAPTPEPRPETPQPQPEPKKPEAAPDRAITIELNLPDGAYHLPFTTKKGERVVLKGKVHTLRVSGLDGGAVYDASGLEAAHVHVGSKVDGGSVLKLNAPNGKVSFAAAVVGKSSVEIVAPGGDVTFTTPGKVGAAIDGGANVNITARTTELRGEVNGVGTRLTVSLPRLGSLKVGAVRGTATVEYRIPDGKGTPDVSAGEVAVTAAFKKVE